MIRITLNDFLFLTHNALLSDTFSDDKIIIEEDEYIENSKEKYIILFANILKKLEDRKFILCPTIIRKFMDVIYIEGYEYQIMLQYVKILEECIKKYQKFKYEYIKDKEYNFSKDDAIVYITEYLRNPIDPENSEYKIIRLVELNYIY